MELPDYTSVYAKLGRAEEHLKVLQSEITAWHQRSSHTFTTERNSDCTRLGFVVHMEGEKPDFLRWTMIVGDFINNVRSALDHLVYAVAKHETRNNPAPKIESLSFVIADTSEDFKEWSRTRLKGLSRGVLAAIERVQPYRSLHPVMPHILDILRDFSNADKHRLLRLANAGIVQAKIQMLTPIRGQKFFHMNPEPLQDNEIFCVIETPEPDPNLTVGDTTFGLEVALWHKPRKGDTNPMSKRTIYDLLLSMMLTEVRTIVAEVQTQVI